MDPERRDDDGPPDALIEEIRAAMARGIEAALAEHRRIGNPVVVWDRERDRILTIAPDAIPAAPAEDRAEDAADPGTIRPARAR